MGCGGCGKTPQEHKPAPSIVNGELRVPAGFEGELRGFEKVGDKYISTQEPCKDRFTTLVLSKDGSYQTYIICQNKEHPIFNILTCPCDCEGCPRRRET